MINKKYDRLSPDGAVGFTEKYHKYTYIDDPSIKFTSVTKVSAPYCKEFNACVIAERVSKTKSSKYYGMTPEAIKKEWNDASARGTMLHDIGEALLHRKVLTEYPDDEAVPYLISAANEILSHGWRVAGTEILFYDKDIRVAGLSDIILTKDSDTYAIYDWKFINELRMKSFYNPRTHTYEKMSGPFKYLNDCNWVHYSIQLSLYQTLSGAPERIKEKVLCVVGTNGYNLVPAYPMRVFWDENNVLQAIYETWGGKWYDSRIDKLLKHKPTDIVGL